MQYKPNPRWIQLPVRLEAPQAELLDRYARATKIPKSSLVRSAVGRFIAELEHSGVRSALEKIHAV
jgi:hypothetical protein